MSLLEIEDKVSTAPSPGRDSSGRPARANPWRSGRSATRAAVGIAWLFAGGLQLQPFMFTRGFSDSGLGSAALSQPQPLRATIEFAQHTVAAHPSAWNWAFALTEIAIGLGLVFGGRSRVARVAALGSVAWGVSVWVVGEGLGGLLTGHAAFSTGAPGAAALYVLLTVAAWPTGRGDEPEPPPARTVAAAGWVVLWLLGAFLATLPAQSGVGGLSDQAGMGWMMSPSWALGPTLGLTHWVGGLSATGAAIVGALLIAGQALIGLALMQDRLSSRVLVVVGSAFALFCWMFGQGFGGVSTGTATDIGTAPLVVILALMVAGTSGVTVSSSERLVNPKRAGRVVQDMNRSAFLAGAAALAIVLTACSSSAKSSAPTTPATTAAVTSAASSAADTSPPASASAGSGINIVNFAYSGELTVKAGEKVTVTNMDSAAHTLTDKATKLFDTGNIPGNGGTGTFTAPTKPGTYKFGCTYHPNMAGTLIVTS